MTPADFGTKISYIMFDVIMTSPQHELGIRQPTKNRGHAINDNRSIVSAFEYWVKY